MATLTSKFWLQFYPTIFSSSSSSSHFLVKVFFSPKFIFTFFLLRSMIFLKNQIKQHHIPLAHPIDCLEFRVKDDDVFGARVMGKTTILAKKIIHGEDPFRVEYVIEIAQQDSETVYGEYLSEGLGIRSLGIDAQYHRIRYATLLCKYGSVKAEKGYFGENGDPPRPRSNFTQKEKVCALHIE
ncbi:hypothetical protein P3L10_023621 [Capsicum annuum]